MSVTSQRPIPDHVTVIRHARRHRAYQVRVDSGKVDRKLSQKKRNFIKLKPAIDAHDAERGDRPRSLQIAASEVTLRGACASTA